MKHQHELNAIDVKRQEEPVFVPESHLAALWNYEPACPFITPRVLARLDSLRGSGGDDNRLGLSLRIFSRPFRST